MDRLLGRIRHISSFFHTSATAMTVLKSEQSLLELPQMRNQQAGTPQDYEMCSGFLSNRQQLKLSSWQTMSRKMPDVHLLSEDDISAGEHVIKVLGPIETITTTLCNERTPTVFMIHSQKEMLIQQLESVK